MPFWILSRAVTAFMEPLIGARLVLIAFSGAASLNPQQPTELVLTLLLKSILWMRKHL